MRLFQLPPCRTLYFFGFSFPPQCTICLQGDLHIHMLIAYRVNSKFPQVAHWPNQASSWFHGPLCPEKVPHFQSSVHADLFVRNTVSFFQRELLPSFRCSLSNVPTALLSLLVIDGSAPCWPQLPRGSGLFYSRAGTSSYLYL